MQEKHLSHTGATASTQYKILQSPSRVKLDNDHLLQRSGCFLAADN